MTGPLIFLPEQLDTVHIGGRFSTVRRQRRLIRKWVRLPNCISGCRHRLHDVVGDTVTPNIPKSSGEPSCYDRATSVQESSQKVGRVSNRQQDGSNIRGIVREEMDGCLDLGGFS